MTLAAALRAQLRRRRAVLAGGAVPVGWKVAASIPRCVGDGGLDDLVFGYFFTLTVFGGPNTRLRPPTTASLAETPRQSLSARTRPSSAIPRRIRVSLTLPKPRTRAGGTAASPADGAFTR